MSDKLKLYRNKSYVYIKDNNIKDKDAYLSFEIVESDFEVFIDALGSHSVVEVVDIPEQQTLVIGEDIDFPNYSFEYIYIDKTLYVRNNNEPHFVKANEETTHSYLFMLNMFKKELGEELDI